MLRPFALASFILVCAAWFSGCGGSSTPAAPNAPAGKQNDKPLVIDRSDPNRKKVIAVIPMSTEHEYWQQVRQGAEAAIAGHNVEIIFKAGSPGNQPEAQLTLVKQMIAQRVDAIVMAPMEKKLMAPAVDDAFEAKIPLVIIDSAIDAPWERYTAYVATDNRDGGAQCAAKLAEALGGKGDVLLFKNAEGVASTTEREEGFKEALKAKFPGIKIIQEKFAGLTHDDALRNANELLAANPKFDGVFASNESSAVGMLKALDEKRLLGKVKYVGFDTAAPLIDAIKKGDMVAVAAQEPFKIGNEGVTQAINALESKKIEPHIALTVVMKDAAALKLEETLRKQEEDEKAREAELKRLKEENEREVEAQRKKIEAEKK